MEAATQLYPEMTPDERRQMLCDNADKIDRGSYYHALTDDEKASKSAKITENLHTVFELEEKLAEIKKGYKEKIDPLKDETRQFTYQVKTGQEERTGDRFHMRDYTAGMVDIVDEEGNLIERRRLYPEERQARLEIR